MNGETKKSLKKLICVCISILFMTVSAKATLVDSNSSIIVDNIEYYMQTNKSVYDLGENVEMLYRVTNLGGLDVTFEFTAGPVDDRGDFIVEKDGERIWDNLHRPRARVLTQFILSPLESRDFTHLWDMMDSGGNQVTPGIYDVTSALGDLGLAYAERYVQVSVQIEIIPEPSTFVLLGTGFTSLLVRKKEHFHRES
jgi:hypothetical protein